jgi:hypothetical protein
VRFDRDRLAAGTDIPSLVAALAGRERSYLTVPLSELRVEDDGRVSCAGTTLGLTRLAAHRLGGRVGLPGRFIDAAPSDIIAWNFNWFLPTARGTVQLAVEGDTVVGVLPERARPVPADLLVDEVAHVQPHVDMAGWALDDRGLHLRFVSPDLASEPRVGDIVRAGVDLWDNENLDGSLAVNGALFRLACTNGAIVPEINFNRELRREMWREPHAVVMAAAGFFQETVEQVSGFGERLRGLTQLPLELPVDPDLRERVLRRPASRPLGIPRSLVPALADAVVAEEPTVYGLYNAVTRLGRDAAAPDVRRRLERAGYLTVIHAEAVATLASIEDEEQ